MTKRSRRGRYRTVCVTNVEVLFGRGVGACRPQIRLFAGSVQSGTDAASSSHAREQEDLRIDRQRTRVPTRPGTREQFHPPLGGGRLCSESSRRSPLFLLCLSYP